MKTEVTVVVGGQFGSEGKGAISAFLTEGWRDDDLAVRVAGPNAGHTVIGKDGEAWKLRCLPVAAVSSKKARLHLAAGSEIDLSVLWSELAALDEAGYKVYDRLTIHPSATILLDQHRDREAAAGLVGRVGSTGKGIGAARADRIMRTATTWGQFVEGTGRTQHRGLTGEPGPLNHRAYKRILIEGTQGYGLGLHTSFYPQVTSSDCRAIDFLGMAGISPWAEDVRLTVVVVARMFPIRVAGNSGPLKDETSWEELGLPEERTTVTNKIRRVGKWDEELVKEAIRANGGGEWHPDVVLALTMLDQQFPDQHGRSDLDDEPDQFVEDLENRLLTHIMYVGTSPNTVVER